MKTATEMLMSQGLTVSLEHVHVEEVIAQAGVPRTAFYRLWSTRTKFVKDFLKELAAPSSWKGTAAFDQKTIEAAEEQALRQLDTLKDPGDRWSLMLEVIRQTVELNFKTVIGSAEWQTYVALVATVMSTTEDEPARTELAQTLQQSEQALLERMVRFYVRMGRLLGVEPKSPYSWMHLAAAGAAVVEGLALRHVINPALVDERIAVVDAGQLRSWTLAAVGFRGIAETMLQLSSNYDLPPAEETQRAEWLESVRLEPGI